jgi:hypothetical protein
MDHVEARRRLENLAMRIEEYQGRTEDRDATACMFAVSFIRAHVAEWDAWNGEPDREVDEIGDLVDEAYELVKDRELGLDEDRIQDRIDYG